MEKNREATKAKILLNTGRVVTYTYFSFLALLTIIPLWLLIVNATRSTVEINAGFSLVPSTHFIDNWKYLTDNRLEPLSALKNTVVLALLSTFISVYTSLMMAWSLVVYRYKMKGFFVALILATMMIPGQVTIIGYYKLVTKLGMMNTPWALALPGISNLGLIYFFRQYLLGVLPLELVEAGRIDGASEFRLFHTILFPIAKPAIMVQMIFSIIGNWNDLYMPSLLLNNRSTRTVMVMLTMLSQQTYVTELGAKYTGIALAILPMIVVFLFFSRRIVDGVTMGSVKG